MRPICRLRKRKKVIFLNEKKKFKNIFHKIYSQCENFIFQKKTILKLKERFFLMNFNLTEPG